MTFLYLYYNQPQAVPRLQYLSNYTKVIFVDDGSQPPLQCQWAKVYRIEQDVQWNQPTANNIGFSMVTTRRTVRLDIDHHIPESELYKLSQIEPQPKELITFQRYHNGKRIRTNYNQYMVRTSDILQEGGYNETYSGHYGYDDTELITRLRAKGWTITQSDVVIEVDTQYETKGIKRNKAVNEAKYTKTYGHTPKQKKIEGRGV